MSNTDDRRPLTVAEHQEFLASLLRPQDFDEIDQLVEDLRAAEFEGKGSRP